MSTFISTVSDKFIPCLLEPKERDVLRAYRCPAGVWTISMGLTAASGVVKPVAGMVISKAESLRLTMAALERNYCPRVRRHLPTNQPHVFDGGTSFDWNTGRIHNASWVGHFLAGRIGEARQSFMQWVRGGGKVLPGLKTRREAEWALMTSGVYPHPATAEVGLTRFSDHANQFKSAGYDQSKLVLSDRQIIEKFQRDHDLKADGLIGPATRAALIRAVEAKRQGQATAGGGAAGTATGAGGEAVSNPDGLAGVSAETATWALGLGIGFAVIVFAGFMIWRHRGPLFMWLPEPVKDFTESMGLTLGRRVRT